jgi:5-deoxy-glucuronate isomerase
VEYTAENLLVRSKDTGGSGVFARVTPEQAGWEYLNMAALRLKASERYAGSTHGHEHVTVLLGGRANIRSGTGDFLNVGRRASVFDGLPYAVYLPPQTDFEIEALTETVELASCWVASDQQHPARLITPQDCAIEIRGGGNATRQIINVIPPGFDCHRLVVVEAYTPSGNWSSYPPHKHDVHRVGEDGRLLEADLEEIYFYKIDKPDGYAYQRVYTGDGRIDALMMARQHDVVLVPEGYHPVVSAHGYTTYYLNFLAGSAQSLANSDDPAYAWIKGTWTEQDARLPLITLEMETRS